jgi:hypothetical protein
MSDQRYRVSYHPEPMTFEEIVANMERLVAHILYKMLPFPLVADAVQEAWLILHRLLQENPGYLADARFNRTYYANGLAGKARDCSRMYYDKKYLRNTCRVHSWYEPTGGIADNDIFNQAIDWTDDVDLKIDLENAIQHTLAESEPDHADREAVSMLVILEGLYASECAPLIGVSKSTLRTHVRGVRKRMQRRLNEYR